MAELECEAQQTFDRRDFAPARSRLVVLFEPSRVGEHVVQEQIAEGLVGAVLEVGHVARVGLARGGAGLRLKPQLDDPFVFFVNFG
jgi:hypothetical protein